MTELQDKIDEYVQIVKDVVVEFETEVDKVQEASATIYNSITMIIESMQNMSDTLVSTVSKAFSQKESDDTSQEGSEFI